ncbi:hypothetical protein I4U23_006052 [Adineta vaga]|nr:hypothetical protein I4U23_006052 [Adineta vaga]
MLQVERKKDRGEHNIRADTMGTNVYSSKDSQSMHNSLNGEFILYQVLLQRILEGKNTDFFEESLLTNYFEPDDKNDRQTMKEFDANYCSSEAIYWYTRESCIYKILNKALRTQNIDDIIPFGSFIKDLDVQLSEEHKQFVKEQDASTIQVYRGQLISKDELNRLKTTQGQLISMNSFLSTSTNRGKAIEFATSRPAPNDELTSILLEIVVDLYAPTKSYADIRHLSAFSDEEEILFMFGSIFHLDQISYDKNLKLWIANLTLCSQNDSDVKDFTSDLANQLEGQNQLIALGTYFIQMMKYDQAEDFYQKILKNKLTENPIELAYCYHGLAQVNERKGEYQLAIEHLNKTLDYLLENCDNDEEDHPLISQSYNDLAKVYAMDNNYILAFQYYEKALETVNNIPSTTYSGLAQIHFQLENYYLALQYLRQALENQPPTAYALIANTYIEIGKIFAKINRKDRASEMFDKAIATQIKLLGADHPDVSYTYSAMAMMYSEMDDQDKALELMNKAHHLQLSSLPNTHSDFADTYRHFGDIYLKIGDLDKALAYYYKSLENQSKTLQWNHPSIAITYITIGNAHRKKKDYKQALVYFHKVLDSELTRKKLGDPSLSQAYKTLGDVYLERNDNDQCLNYYLQYLQNELQTKLYEHISLAETYQIVGNIYFKKRLLSEALLYYNRLLDCHLQKKPFDETIIRNIYMMIGKVYLKKSRITDTLLYYDKLNNKSSNNKYDDINNIHFEKRHLDQVLNYFEKYLKEQMQTRSATDSSLTETYQILGSIYLEKRNTDKALEYLLKLLDTKLNRKMPEDPSLSELYEIIGSIYLQKQDYNKALIYFNQLVDCQLLLKSFGHPFITNVYKTIGKIYLRKNPFDLTSNYLNRNLTHNSKVNLKIIHAEKRHLERTILYFYTLLKTHIEKKDLSFKDFTLEQIYMIIGNLFLEKQDTNQALVYYHQLLHYQYRKNPYDYLLLGQTYEVIGKIYHKQRNLPKALQNYRQSLALYQQMNPKNLRLINNMKFHIREIITPF